jgi:hypothetical protein
VEGCDNAQTLRDEIRDRGYGGGPKTVRRYLNALAERQVKPTAQPPLAVADVVRWIVGRPDHQSETARQKLKDLCDRCEHAAEITRVASEFATLLRCRDGHRLRAWLTRADDSGIKEPQFLASGLARASTPSPPASPPPGTPALRKATSRESSYSSAEATAARASPSFAARSSYATDPSRKASKSQLTKAVDARPPSPVTADLQQVLSSRRQSR